MNRYKPGTAFRVSFVGLSSGVYQDPSNSVVTAFFPNGTSSVGTPVRDSVGLWHADFITPNPCPDGIGFYRWQSSGPTITQNAIVENRFRVISFDSVSA